MGLAIVAAIVAAHRGRVTVEPGPGATFVVKLPARSHEGGESPAVEPAPAKDVGPPSGPRALPTQGRSVVGRAISEKPEAFLDDRTEANVPVADPVRH